MQFIPEPQVARPTLWVRWVRVGVVFPALLAGWALLLECSRWLHYHGVPGSPGLHFFSLVLLAVLWISTAIGEQRLPWLRWHER